jgi:nucleoside-diphosphate-sugar epimerase
MTENARQAQPRVFLTGAGGFVGRAITKHLCQSGLEVIACDLNGAPRVLDVLNRSDVLETALEIQPRVLIHAAAITTPRLENELDLIEVNVQGTINALEAARISGVEHFVFFSSSGVYAATDGPIDEHGLTSSHSAYGLSKLLAEQVCTLGKSSSMTVWLLRLGPIYGPGEQASETRSRTSLVHLIAQSVQTGEHVLLPRAPTDVYNWLHTHDLACLLELIAARPNDGEVYLYNVAGSPVNGPALVAAFQGARPDLDLNSLLEWHSNPPPRHGPLDCTKISRELAWQPTVPLSEGILDYLQLLEVKR